MLEKIRFSFGVLIYSYIIGIGASVLIVLLASFFIEDFGSFEDLVHGTKFYLGLFLALWYSIKFRKIELPGSKFETSIWLAVPYLTYSVIVLTRDGLYKDEDPVVILMALLIIAASYFLTAFVSLKILLKS